MKFDSHLILKKHKALIEFMSKKQLISLIELYDRG